MACEPFLSSQIIFKNNKKGKKIEETLKKIMEVSFFICTVSNCEPFTWALTKLSDIIFLSLRAFVHYTLYLSASDWLDTSIGDILIGSSGLLLVVCHLLAFFPVALLGTGLEKQLVAT